MHTCILSTVIPLESETSKPDVNLSNCSRLSVTRDQDLYAFHLGFPFPGQVLGTVGSVNMMLKCTICNKQVVTFPIRCAAVLYKS